MSHLNFTVHAHVVTLSSILSFQISLTILISLQMRKIMDSHTHLHEHIDRPTRQQQFFNRFNILLDV